MDGFTELLLLSLAAGRPGPGIVVEPEPAVIYEPPVPAAQPSPEPVPPPTPTHRSPRHALLVGIRTGLVFPTGDLWARGEPFGDGDFCCRYFGEDWSSFAKWGPKLELNLGARLNRYYAIYAIWEHVWYGAGSTAGFREQLGGDSNLYGFGFRFSTSPNRVGLLVEVALGFRKFTADLGDGAGLETNAAFSTRLGVGADIRLHPLWSLTPMVTLGGGSFRDVILTEHDGTSQDQISGFNVTSQHLPIALEIGGAFDLFGSR